MRLNPQAFSSEISVGALYLSESFKEAQRRLGYLTEQRGCALITGEVGAGKTTAVRAFTSRLASGSYSIFYTHVSADAREDSRHRHNSRYMPGWVERAPAIPGINQTGAARRIERYYPDVV
ncbi:MAG: AAA family ATPase [Candidatus Xenobiia bacterium LiM19]